MKGKYNMKFVKIIYFDEGSATDYIQLVNGGVLKRTTELIAEANENAEIEAEVGLSVGKKGLFRLLGGAGLNASIEGKAGVDFQKDKIAKTILENTVLTDFVEIIDSDSKKRKEESKQHRSMLQFKKIRMSPIEESFSYYMLMAPFFTMVKGELPFVDEDNHMYNLDVSKIEEAIARGRGYYEFLGDVDGKEAIFRFNNTAFRNNYTLSDIPKMQLSMYAVSVGEYDKGKLNLANEFEFNVNRPKRIEYDEKAKKNDNSMLEIYDVIIAGVEG